MCIGACGYLYAGAGGCTYIGTEREGICYANTKDSTDYFILNGWGYQLLDSRCG